MFKPTRYDLTCDRNIASSSDHDRRLAAAAVARARSNTQQIESLVRHSAGSIPTLKSCKSTKVEVFLGKEVRGCAQTAGANSRRGTTKKREISRNLFSHKSTLLSTGRGICSDSLFWL